MLPSKPFLFFLFFFSFLMEYQGHAQVEFLQDFNDKENGSNPRFFKRFQDRILFFANRSVYSMDTLGGDLNLVAGSIKFINEELTPKPFVVHAGFVFYISEVDNKLWRTDLNQFTNLGIYNYPLHSFYFAGEMPIVIGDHGAFTPFNNSAAAIPIRDDGYLIPIGGLNFFYLPFFDTYRDFGPQPIIDKLYCFVFNSFNNSFSIVSIRENGIASTPLGSIPDLQGSVLLEYSKQSDFTPKLFNPVVTINNVIYFVISRSTSLNTSRNELWKIENDILTKICDFNPANNPSQSGLTHRLYNLNGKIIVLMSSLGFQELWISDGTAANTNFLKSFKTNVLLDDTFATILNNKMYFSAAEVDDFELWETDGTIANTKVFMDLDINISSSPSRFVDTQNGFAFQTNDGSIWMSQGTVGTTQKIPLTIQNLRIKKLENNRFIQVGKYIFGAYDNGIIGSEPFRFDTETLELTQLANLNTTTESFGYDIGLRFKYEDKWFFNGTYDGKRGLFSTDGTIAGTIRNSPQSIDVFPTELAIGLNGMFVKEHTQETFSNGLGFLNFLTKDYTRIDLKKSETENINPGQLFSFNDEAVFLNEDNKQELFISNGLNKPVLLKEFDIKLTSIFTNNSRIFCGSNGLWTYNGSGFTQVTTSLDINLPISVNHFVYFENRIFLFAQFKNDNNESKYGMFVSDGTRAGTILIHTFVGFSSIQDFSFLSTSNNIFFAFKSGNQCRIFEYNKLNDIVRTLTTLDNVDRYIDFMKFAILKNELFMEYKQENKGYVSKLNLTNGLFSVINQGQPNFKYEMEVVNEVLYFRTTTNDNKYRIMRTDGTGVGTYIIPTPFNNQPTFIPRLFLPFADKLLFFSDVDSYGAELFQYTPQLCENTINQSVKSGYWTDSTTWSCGNIPKPTEDIIINRNHIVILLSNEKGEAKSISAILGSVLDIRNGSVLGINQN